MKYYQQTKQNLDYIRILPKKITNLFSDLPETDDLLTTVVVETLLMIATYDEVKMYVF